FTAGGNDYGRYWGGNYTPVAAAAPPTRNNGTQVDHFINQFSGGDQVLTITPTVPISVPFTFAWGDPPGQNASNFEIYWTNVTTPAGSNCISVSTATTNVVTQNITLYPGQNTIYIA